MNINNLWIVRFIQRGHWVKVRGEWMTYIDYLDICVGALDRFFIEDEEIYINYLED